MSCGNTIQDGFYFWIGKLLAELVVGVTVSVVIGVIFMVMVFWPNRGK